MFPERESMHPNGSRPARTEVLQGARRSESGFRPGIPEDRISFRRWRLGFFIFYGAMISLLAGFAALAERPGTFVSAAAQMNPSTPAVTGSTNSMRRHAADDRMRK